MIKLKKCFPKFLYVLLVLEIFFQIENLIYRKEKHQIAEKSQIQTSIFGGSILFLEAQNIKYELILGGHDSNKIEFHTTPRISSKEVLKIIKNFKPAKTKKNIYAMIGHDENIDVIPETPGVEPYSPFKTIQYLVKFFQSKKSTKFDSHTYSMPQFSLDSYSRDDYLVYIKNTLIDIFDNSSSDKTFRDLINISIIYKYIPKQEKELVINSTNELLEEFTPYQKYISKKSNHDSQTLAGLMYLFHGLELDNNIIMPYFANQIFRRTDPNLIYHLQRLDRLSAELAYCEGKKVRTQFHPLDLISLCSLKSVLKMKNKITQKDTLSISYAYVFSSMRRTLKAKKIIFNPKSKLLNELFALDNNNILKKYLSIYTDEFNLTELRKNLLDIKSTCKIKNCVLNLIQYPGYDAIELKDLAKELSIPIIENDPQFILDIKRHGHFEFFRDNLHRTSGHLNIKSGKRWAKYLTSKISKLILD